MTVAVVMGEGMPFQETSERQVDSCPGTTRVGVRIQVFGGDHGGQAIEIRTRDGW